MESACSFRPGSSISLRILGKNLPRDVCADLLGVVDSFYGSPAFAGLLRCMYGAGAVSDPGRVRVRAGWRLSP